MNKIITISREFGSGGKEENYDICINTTNVEIKKIIPSLKLYIENWFGGI